MTAAPSSKIRLTRRRVIALGAGIAAAGGGAGVAAFNAAMREARAAIDPGRSRVVPTRFGALEYAEAGSGPPLLMIHGTGGGFDQGLLFARRMAGAGYRVIAPSRFGYLRSPMPDDPSTEHQADAFADLLDRLEIERIAVAGGSAGALSALQFAIRHPQRCAALFPIVPAAYAPGRPPARPWGRLETIIAQSVLRSDFLFWSAIAAFPDRITQTLLATDPALVRAASPEEQARVRAILNSILPVSERAEGLLLDASLAGDPPRMALEKIVAPTLAISLEDDRYLTADAARHIASEVKGARALIYPTGGHVWVGRDEELFAAISAFLNEVGYAEFPAANSARTR